MDMKQVYTFVNNAVKETIGDSAVLQEDLSNVVDIGTSIFNANAFDAYVKSLINHVGKVIFVDRPYRGSAPSVLMDGWEYGSILEKISSEMPTAKENSSWNLVDGTTYNQDVFYQPSASVSFWNKRTTFEVDRSITELQVKQSFSNATQLNAFVSMLFNEIDKVLTVATDDLIMRTINNMIAETILNDYGITTAGTAPTLSGKTGVRAINLLYKYNSAYTATLTAAEAITTPDFIRYAAYVIGLTSDRLRRISTLFNVGGKQRFTPRDLQHVVFLSDFVRAADVFLQSDVYHDNFTKLIEAETVPFWQGSGTDYNSTGSINAIPVSEANKDTPTPVSVGNVLGVIFDRDALGVTNYDRRVTTHYNAKAEFTNYFYKQDAGYFNDLNENFVVFFIA